MEDKDWDLIHQVHAYGTYSCTKAAWPIMRDQKYGRIINTTSASGLYGNFGQSNYSAMKMSVVGLAYTLAQEGRKRGILVNCIAPGAGSRMTATIMPDEMVQAYKPDYVSPVVAWLCHKDCTETGQVYEAGGGWVAKVKWQRSKGATFDVRDDFGPEKIRDAMDDLRDFSAPSPNFDPNASKEEKSETGQGFKNLIRLGIYERPGKKSRL